MCQFYTTFFGPKLHQTSAYFFQYIQHNIICNYKSFYSAHDFVIYYPPLDSCVLTQPKLDHIFYVWCLKGEFGVGFHIALVCNTVLSHAYIQYAARRYDRVRYIPYFKQFIHSQPRHPHSLRIPINIKAFRQLLSKSRYAVEPTTESY